MSAIFEQLAELRDAAQIAIAASDYGTALNVCEQAMAIIALQPDTEFGDEKSIWKQEDIQNLLNYLRQRANDTKQASLGVIQSVPLRFTR